MKLIRLLFVTLAFSCFSCKQNGEVEKIRLLEDEALKSYSLPRDTLKRKAVAFLTKNLKSHYEAENFIVDREGHPITNVNTLNHLRTDIFSDLDKLHHFQTIVRAKDVDSLSDLIRKTYGKTSVIRESKKYDSNIITSEFLVNNVDFAFASWEESPWKDQIDFATFCEYILPYRVMTERLELWRPKVFSQYNENELIRSKLQHDLVESYANVFTILKGEFTVDTRIDDYYPFNQSVETVLNGKIGTCLDDCLYKITIMRSLGFPVALDIIPHWGNIVGEHYMVKLIGENPSSKKMTNENLPVKTGDIVDVSSEIYDGMKIFSEEELPRGLSIQYIKTVPKVYRSVFEQQPEVDSLIKSAPKEILPDLINSNRKDVTSEYISTANLELDISNAYENHKIAYLCVFDIGGWKPVAFSKIGAKSKAVFEQLPKNVILLPCVYDGEKLLPIDLPFYIQKDGNKHTIIAQSARTETIHLIRKYPLFAYTAVHSEKIMGGTFEGSDFPDFRDAVPISVINWYPFYWNESVAMKKKPFRFLRFKPPHGFTATFAELEFYDEESHVMKGTPIGTPGTYSHELDKAFDNNMDSYFESSEYLGGWIGLDFGEQNKKTVSKIRFCPRNDTNCIIEGNTYELLYWNNSWISLGKKIANTPSLDFTDVPQGALLWLKCHNGGKEERIFIYENDTQIWW